MFLAYFVTIFVAFSFCNQQIAVKELTVLCFLYYFHVQIQKFKNWQTQKFPHLHACTFNVNVSIVGISFVNTTHLLCNSFIILHTD